LRDFNNSAKGFQYGKSPFLKLLELNLNVDLFDFYSEFHHHHLYDWSEDLQRKVTRRKLITNDQMMKWLREK